MRCSGIGGLVGAGRTELLRLIYGLDKPDAGEVYPGWQAATGRTPGGRDRAPASGWRPRIASRRACCCGWSLAKNVSLADLGRFTAAG